ncbi:MAG TPA: 2-phospho-L-lactate transferase [Blastocatellia bacterium]|jgi:LPPG:FO 2-phospho-L-lactate transferase|nr:2-phospho-L-lactate transferase [Blastocatellia bacterium]
MMKITALAGGVGAAKFLLGLSRVLSPEEITIIANTGDDIELFGLRICPDIDTLAYTLSGVINEETGWGIKGDTFESLKWMARYGEASWFNLGDRDLATHIHRTDRLRRGRSLAEVTEHISRALGVRERILPMTESYTPTRVVTDEGEMHFQEYFVRRRCEPKVREIKFDAIESARPGPGVESAIRDADAVIICPSNPFISIGPILAVPGVREALKETRATRLAITPIIGGKALKGPAAEMLRDLGHEVSARGVAGFYRELVDIFVLDQTDAELRPGIEALGPRAAILDTIMKTLDDKRRLAREVMRVLKDARGRGRDAIPRL